MKPLKKKKHLNVIPKFVELFWSFDSNSNLTSANPCTLVSGTLKSLCPTVVPNYCYSYQHPSGMRGHNIDVQKLKFTQWFQTHFHITQWFQTHFHISLIGFLYRMMHVYINYNANKYLRQLLMAKERWFNV